MVAIFGESGWHATTTELQRLLAAGEVAAQTQAEMVKGLLERVGQAPSKTKGKASSGG